MSYKITEIVEKAIAARDDANAFFDRALAMENIEMIRSAISLCQLAEQKLLMAKRHLREKELKLYSDENDSEEIAKTEGKRQFLKNQFEGLTGLKINDL